MTDGQIFHSHSVFEKYWNYHLTLGIYTCYCAPPLSFENYVMIHNGKGPFSGFCWTLMTKNNAMHYADCHFDADCRYIIPFRFSTYMILLLQKLDMHTATLALSRSLHMQLEEIQDLSPTYLFLTH